jgi:hypothetical protein
MIASQLTNLDFRHNRYYGFLFSTISHTVFFLSIIIVSTSTYFSFYSDKPGFDRHDIVAIEIIPEFLVTKEFSKVPTSPSRNANPISENPEDNNASENIIKLEQKANIQDRNVKSPQPKRYTQLLPEHIRKHFPASVKKLGKGTVDVRVDSEGNILEYRFRFLSPTTDPAHIQGLNEAMKHANPAPPPPNGGGTYSFDINV